jgi:general secretion pathway protein J
MILLSQQRAASRSEAVMAAAGFNLWLTITQTVRRRVATHGALERTPAFNRRSATAGTDSGASRGLKPTATFISSLRDEGFTLIEVLIAVMTFAIVLAAVNTVLYGALRLRNKTTQAVEQALPIQQTFAIIKRDLSGIVPPGGVLAGALKSGTATSLGPSTAGMEALGSEAGPEIYTNTGILEESSAWAEVQKVTYYLRDPTNRVAGTGAGKDLIRAVTRNLLPTIEDQPTEQWLMGGIERIDFLFYSGTEWRTSWDSTTEESVLPKAIKVQLQLAANDLDRRARPPLELLVPIFVQARTNQAQATGGLQ